MANPPNPLPDHNRRDFLAAKLATGFALAVQPIAAQTAISTPADGLTAGESKIPTQDGSIPAYRAMPSKGKAFPVVLVVQEIFGVHEHIKDVCRRFAKLGYLAVAPEMYARQGDVSNISSIQDIVAKVVSKVPDAQVMSDLDSTVAWSAKNNGDTARLGITGFCWGGRVVWLYAAHNPKLKAGAAWYGRLVGQPSGMTPKHPVDLAASLQAPVLGFYGGKDQGIPLETVEKMRAALKAANKTGSEIIVYPDAQHGFHADYRPSYNKQDAQDAWKRLLGHFRKNGVA
ncbi:MAG: dienelactone hydrolase family protein [Bryobacteraceae bacterium]